MDEVSFIRADDWITNAIQLQVIHYELDAGARIFIEVKNSSVENGETILWKYAFSDGRAWAENDIGKK